MKQLAKALKQIAENTPQYLYRLYLVVRDPRTPALPRLLGGLLLLYVISPLDLITDFIPVTGYLDDLLIIPFGIWLIIKLLPPELWQDYAEKSSHLLPHAKKLIWLCLVLLLLFWLLLIMVVGFVLL